jgi:hypothetical protein
MRDVNVGSWDREPQLSPELLESLRELNHRFLDLVGNPAGNWLAQHRAGWPCDLSRQLAALSFAERKAIASCPYALFDLRFHDHAHWSSRLLPLSRWPSTQWTVCDAAACDQQTLEFVRLALFFAWHVAATASLAARFFTGMNEMTVTAFRSVTINCIPALAITESVNLTARWSDRPAYWAALTSAASRPNADSLRRIQTSGLQLAAAVQLARQPA